MSSDVETQDKNPSQVHDPLETKSFIQADRQIEKYRAVANAEFMSFLQQNISGIRIQYWVARNPRRGLPSRLDRVQLLVALCL
jgi:hypothetical protein